MRTIDAFSGVGGMALALRGYLEPVVYCELDAACRAVLAKQMALGAIDPAPVHCDVRDLYARAHPADRAAATRLAAALRSAGGDADEEIAALLHDTAKGRTGLLARIVHVLEGSPHGGAARGPVGAQRQRLREHATRVVTIAREAGASPRSVAILTDLAELEANGVVRSAGDGAAARLFLLDSGGHA